MVSVERMKELQELYIGMINEEATAVRIDISRDELFQLIRVLWLEDKEMQINFWADIKNAEIAKKLDYQKNISETERMWW